MSLPALDKVQVERSSGLMASMPSVSEEQRLANPTSLANRLVGLGQPLLLGYLRLRGLHLRETALARQSPTSSPVGR